MFFQKELIPYVPIVDTRHLPPFKGAVLLDDDRSMHTLWKISAKRAGISLCTFSLSKDLFAECNLFDPNCEFYIDEILGDGEDTGTVVAEKLRKMGFEFIFLCTGLNPDLVSPSPWIMKVLGKKPPWV